MTEKEPNGVLGLRSVNSDTNLAKFWRRNRLFHTTISTGAATTTKLFGTWELIPDVSSILTNWGFFRGDPTVTISVTGSAQQMGLLRVFFYPTRNVDTYTWKQFNNLNLADVNNFVYTSQLPHLDLDISMAQTYTITLPFPKSREYMAINDVDNDWTMYFVPVNPVVSIDGSPPLPINLQFFISYDNVVVDRVVPQGGMEAPDNVISSAMRYASRIAKALPISFATPVSKILSLGSDMAEALGYSRTPSEPQLAMVSRLVGNPSLMSGQPDYAFTLGSNPAISRDLSRPMPMGKDNNLFEITRRWAMIMSDVAKEGSPGTYKYKPLNVTPCVSRGQTEGIAPTPLGFITAMFEMWTGNIEVCVQVVSSPLVRYRLGLVILPPGFTAPATFPTHGYLTQVIETAGTTCIDIDVPYLHLEPFQVVEFVGSLAADLTSTRIVLYELTPPTGGSVSPPYPYVNMWIRSGDKFSVGVPNLEKLEPYSYVDDTPLSEEAIIPQGFGEMAISTFGETIQTCEEIATRSVHAYVAESKNGVVNTLYIPILPFPPFHASGTNQTDITEFQGTTWSYVSYLNGAFLGNQGSVCFRVDGDKTLVDKFTIGSFNTDLTSGSLTQFRSNSSRGSVPFVVRNLVQAEVRVPDRNPYVYRGPIIPTSVMECEVLVIDEEDLATTTPTPFDIWVSAGDDYQFIGFLGAPFLFNRV